MQVRVLDRVLTLTEDQKKELAANIIKGTAALRLAQNEHQDEIAKLSEAIYRNDSAGMERSAATLGKLSGEFMAIQAKSLAERYAALTASQPEKFILPLSPAEVSAVLLGERPVPENPAGGNAGPAIARPSPPSGPRVARSDTLPLTLRINAPENATTIRIALRQDASVDLDDVKPIPLDPKIFGGLKGVVAAESIKKLMEGGSTNIQVTGVPTGMKIKDFGEFEVLRTDRGFFPLAGPLKPKGRKNPIGFAAAYWVVWAGRDRGTFLVHLPSKYF